MLIRFGYEFVYRCPRTTPMILNVHVHHTRASDLVAPDHMVSDPALTAGTYHDIFGNRCSRIVAPEGLLRLTADGTIRDSGLPEPVVMDALQHTLEALPHEVLVYLLGSRYCETDLLTDVAWKLFAHTPLGWLRVQAVCDYVHHHVRFGYAHARPTKTAWETYKEGTGVCRDFAHLAIAFCRCLNIPARYCTGYLGDIGVPAADAPMDFAGSMEVYLGGAWHSFDPRNNQRRIGRILIARGRDAADVAITTSYGPHILESFRTWTDEIVQPPLAADGGRPALQGGVLRNTSGLGSIA